MYEGWAIAAGYVDHETGGTSKRPPFQRMFLDARARKFDLVLFWMDRLSREGAANGVMVGFHDLPALAVGVGQFG